MRVVALAMLALAGPFLSQAAAEKPKRKPLEITVQPRSFLDAGNVVPVGRYNGYLNVGRAFGGLPYPGIQAFGSLPLPGPFPQGRGFVVDFVAPEGLRK